MHRKNNFDILRLLAALLVTFSHTFTVLRGSDPLGDATHNQSLGGMGLNIFCVISGFLITKSRFRSDLNKFFISRFLRIFPALVVAIFLMAIFIGPFASSLSFRDYFKSSETWGFAASALVFPLNASLPGVMGNAGLIGQLYSLTAEVLFYLFVGFFGRSKLYNFIVGALVSTVFIVFLVLGYEKLPFEKIFSINIRNINIFFFPVRLGFTCVFYLLSGSLVALFLNEPQKLNSVMPFLAIIWVVALFSANRPVYDVVEMIMFPFVILGIGLAKKWVVNISDFLGDISYGLYIYHFIIAELVRGLQKKIGMNVWIAMMISIFLSILVAWLSYRFVEKRALSFKFQSKNRFIKN